MNEKFFEQEPKAVAQALLGKVMIVGDVKAAILEAKGFRRATNTGIYEPVTQMPAGDVYCPRVRNSIIILLATHDRGQIGGCVLIRVAEVEAVIYDGPGKVAERMGITVPKTSGKAKWIDEDTFVIGLDSLPEPVIKKSAGKKPRTGNQIGSKTLADLMPKITEKYMREKPAQSFQDFVNGLLESCQNEADLRKRLREGRHDG